MNAMLQDRSATTVRTGPGHAFRSLLVHVQPEAEAQPRLAVAAALARQFDATLIGVGAETVPPGAIASDPYGIVSADWIVVMRDQIAVNLKNAKEAFLASAEGLNSEWLELEAFPAPALAKISRGADLIIAGGSPLEFADKSRWCDPAALVLLSGRPVLVVPPKGGRLSAGKILIAWKDTREARRAVADSLPLLQNATDVVVMEICDDALGEAEYRTLSVVENLKRHGGKARAKAAMASPAGAAEDLDRAAEAMGADLIVAGAYGHSRLNEWVFGGVTRDLLRTPRRFVLFSH
jgi:nucleotide-binding universal stress UspA family protein